jgi:nitronate monooxygenase
VIGLLAVNVMRAVSEYAALVRTALDKGLFFRGAGASPFGDRIATVRVLIERLLTPGVAAGTA